MWNSDDTLANFDLVEEILQRRTHLPHNLELEETGIFENWEDNEILVPKHPRTFAEPIHIVEERFNLLNLEPDHDSSAENVQPDALYICMICGFFCTSMDLVVDTKTYRTVCDSCAFVEFDEDHPMDKDIVVCEAYNGELLVKSSSQNSIPELTDSIERLFVYDEGDERAEFAEMAELELQQYILDPIESEEVAAPASPAPTVSSGYESHLSVSPTWSDEDDDDKEPSEPIEKTHLIRASKGKKSFGASAASDSIDDAVHVPKKTSSKTTKGKTTKKTGKFIAKEETKENPEILLSKYHHYSDESEDESCYCYCNGPSTDDTMIACDAEACKIEWFHYGCVDVLEAPTGKWYCPSCIKSLQK